MINSASKSSIIGIKTQDFFNKDDSNDEDDEEDLNED